nr:dihydroneopterin aldolase [Marinicella rhabdoformis]
MIGVDKVLIRGLKVDATIGIHDWEKQIKQPVVLDVDLSYDCYAAGQSDDIKDALDYFAVSQKLSHFISLSHFELIEALAEHCCQLLLKQFPVNKVKLTLSKPEAVPNAQSVAVQLVRKA